MKKKRTLVEIKTINITKFVPLFLNNKRHFIGVSRKTSAIQIQDSNSSLDHVSLFQFLIEHFNDESWIERTSFVVHVYFFLSSSFSCFLRTFTNEKNMFHLNFTFKFILILFIFYFFYLLASLNKWSLGFQNVKIKMPTYFILGSSIWKARTCRKYVTNV